MGLWPVLAGGRPGGAAAGARVALLPGGASVAVVAGQALA